VKSLLSGFVLFLLLGSVSEAESLIKMSNISNSPSGKVELLNQLEQSFEQRSNGTVRLKGYPCAATPRQYAEELDVPLDHLVSYVQGLTSKPVPSGPLLTSALGWNSCRVITRTFDDSKLGPGFALYDGNVPVIDLRSGNVANKAVKQVAVVVTPQPLKPIALAYADAKAKATCIGQDGVPHVSATEVARKDENVGRSMIANATASAVADVSVICTAPPVAPTQAPIQAPAPVVLLPKMEMDCWLGAEVRGFNRPQTLRIDINGRPSGHFIIGYNDQRRFYGFPCDIVNALRVHLCLEGSPTGQGYEIDLAEARRAINEAQRRYRAGEFHPGKVNVVFNRKIAILTKDASPYGNWQTGLHFAPSSQYQGNYVFAELLGAVGEAFERGRH